MCIYWDFETSEKISGQNGSMVSVASPIVEITGRNGKKIPAFWGKSIDSEKKKDSLKRIFNEKTPSFDEVPAGLGDGREWER